MVIDGVSKKSANTPIGYPVVNVLDIERGKVRATRALATAAHLFARQRRPHIHHLERRVTRTGPQLALDPFGLPVAVVLQIDEVGNAAVAFERFDQAMRAPALVSMDQRGRSRVPG